MTSVTAVVLGAVLGASLASFACVVAQRGLRAALSGRSHCEMCGHTLAPLDLVPMVSYLAMRGRCRSCGGHIASRLLVAESAGAVAGAGAVAVALVVAGR